MKKVDEKLENTIRAVCDDYEIKYYFDKNRMSFDEFIRSMCLNVERRFSEREKKQTKEDFPFTKP